MLFYPNFCYSIGIYQIANPKGVLAIDDTARPKPYAEKTEGAKFQYCGPLGREENCNVAVASCFVSNSKHFPGDFKSYLPITTPNPQNFKSKLDLAKELIDDAVAKALPSCNYKHSIE